MESYKPLKTCRLCGNDGPNFRAIFKGKEKNEIADKISKCLPILVSSTDELPGHICPLCLRSLNISYKLLIKVIETDGKLRQQLSQSRGQCNNQECPPVPQNLSGELKNSQPGICGFCEIRFEDAGAFDSHMETFHHSKWVCNLCQCSFATSDELLQHKHKTHYDNMGSEDCPDTGIIDIKEERISASEQSDTEPHYSRKDKKRKAPKGSKNEKAEEKLVRINCGICNLLIDEPFMVNHKEIHEPFELFCTRCRNKFPSAYDLIKHKREAHDYFTQRAIRYFCRVCNRMMSDSKALKAHRNCDKPRHQCKYCDETFNVKQLLRLHQNREHRAKMMEDKEVEKLECAKCKKIFVDKKTFYDHVYLHGRQLVFRYHCQFCSRHFGSSSSMKNHVESVHEKLLKYSCNTCRKKFYNKKNLHTHEKIHMKLNCHRCNARFENVELVQEHLEREHSVPMKVKRMHVCPHCEKQFSRRSILEDHKNTHSGETPQSCKICGKQFRTYAARWAHQQRHMSDGFFCDYCQRKFVNKGHLKTHLQVHMPPEEWKYVCEICQIRYPQGYQLVNHMRRHTGERHYLCDMCGSKFGKKSHLDKHLRTVHVNSMNPVAARLGV